MKGVKCLLQMPAPAGVWANGGLLAVSPFTSVTSGSIWTRPRSTPPSLGPSHGTVPPSAPSPHLHPSVARQAAASPLLSINNSGPDWLLPPQSRNILFPLLRQEEGWGGTTEEEMLRLLNKSSSSKAASAQRIKARIQMKCLQQEERRHSLKWSEI